MLPKSMTELEKIRAPCSVAAMMHLGNSHIDACFEVARGAIEE